MVIDVVLAPFIALEKFFDTYGDKRSGNLLFMDSSTKVILLAIFYVYFSIDLGPKRLMKNREAFDLVWVVRIFNSFILLLNIWLLLRFLWMTDMGFRSFGCSPVDSDAIKAMDILHLFCYSRLLELIDTVWICLRKKNRQITFLHVFHHSFVLLMTWCYLRLAPGGSSLMFPIVNGFVHVIMYLYYILSTFDSLKPYLWWKKYVTRLQLIQFVILSIHFIIAALTPNCEYPRILSISGASIGGMFFVLFASFYKETYVEKQQLLKHKSIPQQQQKLKQSIIYEKNNNNNNNNNNSSTVINQNNAYHKLSDAKTK